MMRMLPRRKCMKVEKKKKTKKSINVNFFDRFTGSRPVVEVKALVLAHHD